MRGIACPQRPQPRLPHGFGSGTQQMLQSLAAAGVVALSVSDIAPAVVRCFLTITHIVFLLTPTQCHTKNHDVIAWTNAVQGRRSFKFFIEGRKVPTGGQSPTFAFPHFSLNPVSWHTHHPF